MADDKHTKHEHAPPEPAHVAPAPPIGHSPPDRAARPHDAPHPADAPQPGYREIPPEQLVTPPAGPPQLGGKSVQAIIGPHTGSVLTMPTAEADQAINDHWAIDVPHPPFDATATDDHPPLTDEERKAAQDAAQTWADAQVKPPEETPPPGDGEGVIDAKGKRSYPTRDVTAEHHSKK